MLAIAVVFVGCDDPPPETAVVEEPSHIVSINQTLNTLIAQSLEIDELSGGPTNANLFVGTDPADSSASAQLPTGGPATWIDWDDLGGDLANHRLLDLVGADGKDPTAFPQSNECVAKAGVLSKMDLTYVASANNQQYAYFAVQRSDNNGDAGYYWIFNHVAPTAIQAEAPCSADQDRLVYKISRNDVLLAGHFKPSALALLRVYRATGSAVPATGSINRTAVEAVNFTDTTVWTLDAAGVAAVAVNTDITDPGTFGAAGVNRTAIDADGNVKPEIFAEAAVPLSVFTGGTCGAIFYGSVITRSSGSGGTSPDLKDLAGPAIFAFGSMNATATLTPTCGLSAGYAVTSAIDNFGATIASPTCAWYYDGASSPTSTSCNGSQSLTAGAHTARVRVTDPGSGCYDDVENLAVTLYSPLSASVTVTPYCDANATFDYGVSSVTGGSGTVTYSWGFSPAASATPSSSTTASGTVDGSPGVTYTASLTVTDSRSDSPSDGPCTAFASAQTTPYSPIVVNLTPSTASLVCTGSPAELASDAVMYTATITGGGGPYEVTWNGATCSGLTCTIDPAATSLCYDQTISATVSDSTLCADATSEEETYSKRTTVNATDAP